MPDSPHSDQTQTDLAAMISGAQSGDEQAIADLWEYCFPRLLRHARGKLPAHLRRVLDEEDVALSAFKSFCLRAADGTLGPIRGRDELWKLLYTITSRKAHGYVRHQTREKRGGGFVRGESTFSSSTDSKSDSGAEDGLEQIAGDPDTPQSPAEFQSRCQNLLDQLDDPLLQATAMLRLEGYRVDEIAERMDCAKRSVERRLNLIRTIWSSDP